MSFIDKAKAIESQIIEWRRDIHMHPELGFEETRTSRLVADALREMGIEIEVGIAETGIVARIGEGSPKVGIRADMDALPIDEANDVPYKSQTPGLMHACGHDAHTAILLGVARMLTEMEDRPEGEIRLLFQPSEEKWREDGHSGGSLMVEQKAADDLDAVIALHVSSTDPAGQVKITPGNALAAADTFEATIIGEGTHGASPHNGIDPIWIQAQVVNAIQAIRSRRLNPTDASVITIGAIHAGSAPNVIPHEVKIKGTIRSYTEEVRDEQHRLLEEAFAISRQFGGDYTLKISRGYPPMYNNPEIADLMRGVSIDLIGEEATTEGQPSMGAEDFSYMSQKAPGTMIFLGAKYDDMNRPHHSPIFDISEDAFHVGAAVLAESAIRLLKEKA
jgi:amidohydrolase